MTKSTSGLRLKLGQGPAEFERLVAIETDECVLWPYGRDGAGYGILTIKGKKNGVHTLACARHHGQPPDGRVHAAHTCREITCMNGRHLSWKTPAENAADKVRDGTAQRGESSPRAKLTEARVRLIRSSGESVSRLAQRHGVAEATIRDVLRRKTWTHI